MQDEQQPDLVGLSAEIVSAYVAKNHIQTSEISQLIQRSRRPQECGKACAGTREA